MERGFLESLFPGKRFKDLSPDERRLYSTTWSRQRGDMVRAAAFANRHEKNRKRREQINQDAELKALVRAREAEWRKTHPSRTAEQYRRYRLKVEYGLTMEDYSRMLAKQCGLCALCGARYSGSSYRHLAVDHDHRTGQVRGLLCHNCNLVLGHLRDDVSLMRRAIAYLRAHGAGNPKASRSSGRLFLDESAA